MLDTYPATIITGKKAIITKAICQPSINAMIIPLAPMLIFIKTDVTLLTRH